MKSSYNLINKYFILPVLFFLAQFLYFLKCIPGHLTFPEQVQLFRYDRDYFQHFLLKPGGIIEYAGAFMVQFFISPVVAAILVSLAGIGVFILSIRIFRRFHIHGIIWSLIPVMAIPALQSDHRYQFGLSLGFLTALLLVSIYTSVSANRYRMLTGILGFLILYVVTGAFSIFALSICLLYETAILKGPFRFQNSLIYFILLCFFPYLAWRYVYLIPLHDAWLHPLSSLINGASRNTLFILIGYFPLFLLFMLVLMKGLRKSSILFGWNPLNILGGIIVLTGISILIKKYSYDPKMEQILRIDNCLQKSEWNKALELCSDYPEAHRMVIYFTNIALIKSGQMGDKMFHYRQVGSEGLSLPWTTNNFIPFFGCEIFYHLGYINEAYRWAFEATVVNGNCPRLLKHLVMTSLINRDYAVAKKYLMLLNESLFYRSWARHYLNMIRMPGLIEKDKEINDKRRLLIQTDFFAGEDESGLGLTRLLANHPDNQMAFEYYISSLLLDKDILTFATQVDRLKDFIYRQIPVHFEEAIVWYMGYSKKNIVPEGFVIRESTIQRFNNYANLYSTYSGLPGNMAESMKKYFGTSYWFYYHFVNYNAARQ